jgi:polyisoprenoid-binding protein YceI
VPCPPLWVGMPPNGWPAPRGDCLLSVGMPTRAWAWHRSTAVSNPIDNRSRQIESYRFDASHATVGDRHMITTYRLEPTRSRFTVQAFATGMLSFFGHSPTFNVGDLSGSLVFEGGKVSGLRLTLTIRSESIVLVDRVSDGDRRDIEGTMRRDVLETGVYPEITYAADGAASESVARGQYRVRINGRLTLHGVTRDHPLDTEMVVFDDGIRLRGGSQLRLSDYRIRPVTALAGTIKLKDELKVSFDVAGLPQGA